MKFLKKIFPPSKITLSLHRFIKEFYKNIHSLYKLHSSPGINWCVPNETGHDSLQGCLLEENVMPKL